MQDSFELRLVRAMGYGSTSDWAPNEEILDDQGMPDHQRVGAIDRTLRETTIKEFLERYPVPGDGIAVLNKVLEEAVAADFRQGPYFFLQQLANEDVDYATAICQQLIASPEMRLASYLAYLIAGVASKDRDIARILARQAINTGHPLLNASLGGFFSWLDVAAIQEVDIAMLKSLLAHPDPVVKSQTLQSLLRLVANQDDLHRMIIDLALGVDLADDTELAEQFFTLFSPRHGIQLSDLTDEELLVLVAKLAPVKQLVDVMSGHFTQEFLSQVSTRLPSAVVDLLMKRIDRASETATAGFVAVQPAVPPSESATGPLRKRWSTSTRYDALPLLNVDLGLANFAATSEYQAKLRSVGDRILAEEDYVRSSALTTLLGRMLVDFPERGLAVLDEWVSSGNGERILLVARTLREAHHSFVFTHREFVVRLLNSAYAVGAECYELVCQNLGASARSFAREAEAGQPFPQDIELRDRSRAAAEQVDRRRISSRALLSRPGQGSGC